MKLLSSIVTIGRKLRWLWPGYCWRELARQKANMKDHNDGWTAVCSWKEHLLEQANERAKVATESFKNLRAQVMQLRVHQARHPRTGWEIMAYIPNEVVKKLQDDPTGELRRYVIDKVAYGLVAYAVQGVVNVDRQGRVNALVFEPLRLDGAARDPRWVQVLWEKDGNLSLSERLPLIDPGTEEQRVRRASQ